jgi:hypothetical protein
MFNKNSLRPWLLRVKLLSWPAGFYGVPVSISSSAGEIVKGLPVTV